MWHRCNHGFVILWRGCRCARVTIVGRVASDLERDGMSKSAGWGVKFWAYCTAPRHRWIPEWVRTWRTTRNWCDGVRATPIRGADSGPSKVAPRKYSLPIQVYEAKIAQISVSCEADFETNSPTISCAARASAKQELTASKWETPWSEMSFKHNLGWSFASVLEAWFWYESRGIPKIEFSRRKNACRAMQYALRLSIHPSEPDGTQRIHSN